MARQKVTSLTPEQIAKFSAYVAEWKGYGLSTEPADRSRAEAAIRWMYEAAGKKPPRIVWTQSPLGNVLAFAVMTKGDQVGDQVRDQVGDQVRDQVRAQVGDQVRAQVWAQVGAQVGAQVRAQVWDQVRAGVYGQHDASWLAFHRYFFVECGLVDETKALAGLWDLCQSAGWALPYENVCFVSDRHDICALDETGRIHCETGPAIRYRDGFAIHAWHGTRIPAEWVEQRKTIDPAIILKAENVEQRSAGAALIGWPRMVSALKRKIIDGDPDSDMGALIELTMPGLQEPGRFLQAKCPRNGTIVEGVPRLSDIDGLPINTVIAAQAWRIGDPQSEYVHPHKRT